MVTINPQDAKPDEVYEGTVHGAERTVLIRRDASDPYPWESLGEVLDHEDVSGLVRLVPAREVTRQDLPRIAGADVAHDSIIEGVLDAVVAHLNANGGVPASREDAALADRLERQAATISELQGSFLRVERDADRWRRAHAIVEQERDTAREALADIRSTLKATNDAMVEAAERERDEALEASALFQRDVHEWRTRAEAAEARTAVTREDVDDAVRTGMSGLSAMLAEHSLREAADAVCALFGVEAEPTDPVTEKARELAKAGGIDFDEQEPDGVEMLLSMARHVLGQEAGQ